jgi:hypothetical protein
MANIGINCAAEVIGATRSNTWVIPLDNEGDLFPPLTQYFENPLKDNSPMSVFITFPSLKDTSSNENKTSCQMLFMAEFDWFKEFIPSTNRSSGDEENSYETYEGNERLFGYDKCKDLWKEKSLQLFLKYFPKVKASFLIRFIHES